MDQWDDLIVDATQYIEEATTSYLKIWEFDEKLTQAFVMPLIQKIGQLAPSHICIAKMDHRKDQK